MLMAQLPACRKVKFRSRTLYTGGSGTVGFYFTITNFPTPVNLIDVWSVTRI